MPGRWREGAWRLGRTLGPPLIALALAESLLWAGAVLSGEDPRRASAWVRWDSYRYIDIARRGYVEVEDDPSTSNAGWFPGFPVLVRLAAGVTHTKPARAGRAVADVFELGLLVLVWSRLLPPGPRVRRWLALFAAALFPGFFYRHAVFPMSMVTFFGLAAIALVERGSFLAGGTFGALGAFTYPTGVVVAAPLALAAARAPGLCLRARLRAWLAGPGLAVCGLAAVFGLHQVLVGRWDAFLRYQQQEQDIGRGVYNPLGVLLAQVRAAFRAPPDPKSLVSLQALLVTGLLLLAAWIFWREGSGRRPVDALLLTHATVFWIFAHAAGPNVALHRQAAVLPGLVPLLAHRRAPLLALLLAIFATLGAGMARLFFDKVLV